MTKEEVLSLLLTAGEPVSGEHICRQLGVTRAAVWKAIDQLRQEGYTIEAAPRRGYTLTARPDRLDTAQVRGYLAGHPWQPLVTAVERVDSTNNACKRLAAEGAPDGTAVLTGMQTAGRGRRGRTFVSPPGGLYFSLILRPHAQPEALMHLTAMVAVAAARAIERVSGVYPGIKWTNDLVLGKKKLCGILTEIGIEAESHEVDYAVVGIGINKHFYVHKVTYTLVRHNQNALKNYNIVWTHVYGFFLARAGDVVVGGHVNRFAIFKCIQMRKQQVPIECCRLVEVNLLTVFHGHMA